MSMTSSFLPQTLYFLKKPCSCKRNPLNFPKITSAEFFKIPPESPLIYLFLALSAFPPSRQPGPLIQRAEAIEQRENCGKDTKLCCAFKVHHVRIALAAQEAKGIPGVPV